MQRILAYRWPGNVRQLRALCERWMITRANQRVEQEHLPADMKGGKTEGGSVDAFFVDERNTLKENSTRVMQQVERAYFFRLLRKHRGKIEKTAEAAGISRRTLYTKLQTVGLDASDFRKKSTLAPPKK